MDNPTDHFMHDQQIIDQSMLYINDLNHNTEGLNTSGGIYWDMSVTIHSQKSSSYSTRYFMTSFISEVPK